MDQQQIQQRPLPNSTIVLVLGILSIVLCFCYGIIGLVLGIIALVLAKKDRKLYDANPEWYTQASFKNLNAGKICAIIGLSFSALYIIYVIIIIGIVGFSSLNNPQELINRINELKK